MIILTLKNGNTVEFKMSTFEKEAKLADSFPDMKKGFKLNLKQKGFYMIEEIESIKHFPITVLPKAEDNTDDIMKHVMSNLSKKKETNARAFTEMVQSKMGYVPVDSPVFGQYLENVMDLSTDELSWKLPMYVNLFINTIKSN